MHETNVTIQTIAQFLDERQWRYDVVDFPARIETGFASNHGVFPIAMALVEDCPILNLLVIVRIPLLVPEDRRSQMAEAIVRADYGLKLGSFVMNMNDGRMRFVTGMPIRGGSMVIEQFDDLLDGAIYLVDQYFRAFARLLYTDDLSPAEAIAEVEMAK